MARVKSMELKSLDIPGLDADVNWIVNPQVTRWLNANPDEVVLTIELEVEVLWVFSATEQVEIKARDVSHQLNNLNT